MFLHLPPMDNHAVEIILWRLPPPKGRKRIAKGGSQADGKIMSNIKFVLLSFWTRFCYPFSIRLLSFCDSILLLSLLGFRLWKERIRIDLLSICHSFAIRLLSVCDPILLLYFLGFRLRNKRNKKTPYLSCHPSAIRLLTVYYPFAIPILLLSFLGFRLKNKKELRNKCSQER